MKDCLFLRGRKSEEKIEPTFQLLFILKMHEYCLNYKFNNLYTEIYLTLNNRLISLNLGIKYIYIFTKVHLQVIFVSYLIKFFMK